MPLPVPKSRRAWRLEVKKLRRRRIRQAAAQLRQSNPSKGIPKLSENNHKPRVTAYTPGHLTRLAEERTAALLAEEQAEQLAQQLAEDQAAQQRAETHCLWQAYDALCTAAWADKQSKLELTERAKKAERERIQSEFEALERRKVEQRLERVRIANEKQKAHEVLQQRITDYLLDEAPMPDELRQATETNAGREQCRMYAKTGACRFGIKCTHNHRRPGISRVLLFPQLFVQIQADRQPPLNIAELDEAADRRWPQAYTEFFDDVVPEMEKLGRVTQFRVARNQAAHLTGNVMVEFETEKSALQAQRQLSGRFYAGCLLKPEFISLDSWKVAVCGLSFANKCPRADCNNLHVFRNPSNRFPFISKVTSVTNMFQPQGQGNQSAANPQSSKQLQWDDLDDLDRSRHNPSSTMRSNKDWRWSESPAPESIRSARRRSSRSRSRSRHGHSRPGHRLPSRRQASDSTRSSHNHRIDRSSSPAPSNRSSSMRSGRTSARSSRSRTRQHSRSRSRTRQYSKSRSREQSRRTRSRSKSKSSKRRSRSRTRHPSKSRSRERSKSDSSKRRNK